VQRLRIAGELVARAPALGELGVFRSDRRIVETGRHAVRRRDLAFAVLQQVREAAVQHARLSAVEARGVVAGRVAVAAGFDADQLDLRIADEGAEQPDGVAAAADAREREIGQAFGMGEDLRARFVADHALELGHQRRKRMRPQRAAEQVVRLWIADPRAQRLVDRVLERLLAVLDLAHARAEQLHAQHVHALARGVDRAHVHHALEAEQRARGRGRDAVLSRAGLGQHAALAHAFGEQRLTERVVELVRAGVEQVLALEPHLAAELARQSLRVPQRRRSAGVVAEEPCELAPKLASARASSQARSSSSSGAIKVSGA
jgi:hypothetical protein